MDKPTPKADVFQANRDRFGFSREIAARTGAEYSRSKKSKGLARSVSTLNMLSTESVCVGWSNHASTTMLPSWSRHSLCPAGAGAIESWCWSRRCDPSWRGRKRKVCGSK